MPPFDKMASAAGEHPIAISGALIVAVLALLLVGLLLAPTTRQQLRKLGYLTLNAFVVDLGWRDALYWGILTALFAVIVALPQLLGKQGEPLHWRTFVFIIVGAVAARLLAAIFEVLAKGGWVLRPLHGAVWREERKSATAAIISKITAMLVSGEDIEKARAILTDLLRVIVIHVRDHRGDHTKGRVFANLLLPDGEDLVVVARDPTLQGDRFRRDVPKRYKKVLLAAGRALESGSPVSVGDVAQQYPEGPQNKPYASILALPVFGSVGEQPIGVVCIDSSRPYFFESFVPGATENTLENSLAPYLETLVLVLEVLISEDPAAMLRKLIDVPAGA